MTAYASFSDQELTVLLKAGSKDAFAEIYSRYKYLLYLHAFKRLRDVSVAEDTVHDLFAVLWTNREELEVKTSLSGYLFTAVRNRIFKFLARQSVESEYVSSFALAAERSVELTDHKVRENQFKAIIDREIEALPEKMKEVFLLSRREHLSHAEIAERLGISELTVTKQVSNALKILRTKLGLFLYLIFLIRF